MVTLIVAASLYFYIKGLQKAEDPKETEVEVDGGKAKEEPDPSVPPPTPEAYACEMAGKKTSFLGYLRALDKEVGLECPPHCRSVDFYLACREDAKEV